MKRCAELTAARLERAKEGKAISQGSWADAERADQNDDGQVYLESLRLSAAELADQSGGGGGGRAVKAPLRDEDVSAVPDTCSSGRKSSSAGLCANSFADEEAEVVVVTSEEVLLDEEMPFCPSVSVVGTAGGLLVTGSADAAELSSVEVLGAAERASSTVEDLNELD